jgi:hypothetical protein
MVGKLKAKQENTTDQPQEPDSRVSFIEKGLASHLSAKVSLRFKKNGAGKLEINFQSKEELNRLLEVLGYAEDFT